MVFALPLYINVEIFVIHRNVLEDIPIIIHLD